MCDCYFENPSQTDDVLIIMESVNADNQFNSYHRFVIQVNKRDVLKNYLKSNNINTAIHYPIPIHLQPASKSLGYKQNDFRIAEKQAKRILTLPINQHLKKTEIKYISEKINFFFKKK